MGQRIRQDIYTCDLCSTTPEDGECCDKADNENEE